VQTIYKKPSCR